MEFSFHDEIARITHSADEAAFVHRVWWLTYNNEVNGRNLHDGKYWTYDSVQALAKIFDFWTPKQLRRIIENCVRLGLIETGRHAENAFDRRTWYTVTERVKSIYRDGRDDLPERANGGIADLPKPAEGSVREGEPARPDGQMEEPAPVRAETDGPRNGLVDLPERANADDQSGKSDMPEKANLICPNGQMIKGAKKDLLEDLRESAPAAEPKPKAAKREPKRDAWRSCAGEDAELLQALEDFEAMRLRRKKPMTERARRMLLGRLEQLAGGSRDAKIRMLEASILHCWDTVYPPKDEDGRPAGAGGKAGGLIEEDWV